MRSFSSFDKNILLGVLCVCLYMIPYILYGEDSFITIHDHLDSTIAHYQNIKNNGLLFEHHGIVPVLCGIDRVYFSSYPYLELKLFLYSIMPMYWAIIGACFLWKMTAFVGMYLLLKHYIVPKRQKWIAFFSAILFALIPFYVDYSLSSAGMPLLFYSFLNIMTQKKGLWVDFLIILYVGLNSSLALSGFFALIVLIFMALYYYRKTKIMPINMLLGIFFLSVIYLLTNVETLWSLFVGGDFISHRTEFANSTNAIRDLVIWGKMLLFSQYHAGSMFCFPILFIYVWLYLHFRKKIEMQSLLLISLIVIFGALIGVLGKIIGLGIFSSIQFDRFYFLLPTICVVLFAKECSIIEDYKHIPKKWIIACGFLMVVPFIKEYRCFAERLIGLKTEIPTYSQFYDVTLFEKMKSDLGIHSDYSTKVVCLGFFPSIAEYNGLYTLDSYFYNYPLEYKHLFRSIIKDELNKSGMLKIYFDKWGSRCYLFSSEIGLINPKGINKKEIVKLEIDILLLKKMGCDYLLSSIPISNHCDLGIKYTNKYSDNKSGRELFVYKI